MGSRVCERVANGGKCRSTGNVCYLRGIACFHTKYVKKQRESKSWAVLDSGLGSLKCQKAEKLIQ